MTSETSSTLVTLTTTAAIGTGLVGGAFFAFSSFVMHALDELPPARAIEAMNAINRAAPSAAFMTAIFGTAAVCVAVGGTAIAQWGQPGSTHRLVGSALYLAGVAVTVGFHVPRNDALLLVDPSKVDAARTWARYAGPWTLGNHVRTLTSLGAAVAFTLGLRAG
ncbi:DUF1772 domain-containing protein [Aquihabitans sp. G128]|uniref:anthrone oxygenase family protein n=1 Tax=Aquihabitans sp. G128 TaxID=2849779 RepID=UPI001C23ABDC|nr:anthrone oxygenase family protein [Aquihabitans sp. G128]QXC60002.1 DUF1772 domain-containing protein [Aquihabitans sp. G128]